MIFYEGSPRRCSPEEAERIAAALRRKVELCGVFVNAPLEQVVAASEELGLSMLQFHGDEGPSFCAEAARRNGRAGDQGGAGRRARRRARRRALSRRLPPARRAREGRRQAGLRGGTGETFDWALVRARRSKVPLILSGGLTADNVGRGDRGRRTPTRVDTASGTEAAPGRKDPREAAGVVRPPCERPASRGAESSPSDRRRGGGRGVSADAADAGGRAPLRRVRRAVRPRDADAGAGRARAGVDCRRARRGLPRGARRRCCATSAGARRRCIASMN